MAELTKAEALKGEKEEKERDLQQLTETSGASGHQKLRVCDICGAYLSVLDSDRRLADHFGGRVSLKATTTCSRDAESLAHSSDASRLPSTASIHGRMARTWPSSNRSSSVLPSWRYGARTRRTQQRLRPSADCADWPGSAQSHSGAATTTAIFPAHPTAAPAAAAAAQRSPTRPTTSFIRALERWLSQWTRRIGSRPWRRR